MSSEDQRFTTRRKVLAASGSATMVGLAGCAGLTGDDEETDDEETDDGEMTEPDDDSSEPNEEEPVESTVTLLVEGVGGYEDDHDDEVSHFDVIDRDTDEVTADIHGDHWHGSLPHIHEGEHISLGAHVEDGHGDEIELDGDHWELRVRLADGAHEDVVSFDYHGDHVHIIGDHEGETEVVFQLYHDDHVEYETPPITAEVEPHGHDDDDDHGHDDDHDDEVSYFEVIDRDSDEVTAYVHDDHWDGSLPHIDEGEHISLGAHVEDDHGDEIELDGDHWELRVALAHDAPEDVVSFDYHGDHVHIIGDHEGETEVVFQLYHDDHVEYETPPITAEVEHHGHDDDDHHDISEDGLSEHDIDHACGHMEFDEPEDLDGGESAEDAPSIDATHQPFAVTFNGDSGFVRFVAEEDDHGHDDDDGHDHGHGEMFAFFTEGETITVVEGHTVYEDAGPVEGCDDIGKYVVAEPDHGEVVVELSAE